MLSAYILRSDGSINTNTDRDSLAAALHDEGSRFWVDIFQPIDDDIAILRDVFKFHALAIEDSYTYTQRPKIEHYEAEHGECPVGYFYMVFHGPDVETFREHLRTKEVDVFVSPRFIVSVHDEPMRSIDALVDYVKKDPKVALSSGVDVLLYRLLDKIAELYDPILDFLDKRLDMLEERALERPTKDLLPKMGRRKRELLNLRRVIGPQREVVAQLARGDVTFISEATRPYFRDVLDRLVRIVEMVELYRDLVQGARDIYLSSISNQLNQIMKTLTIFSVIALPLTVITGFFGMNFDYLPGIHKATGFWWMLGLTLCIEAGLLTWFKLKRWI